MPTSKVPHPFNCVFDKFSHFNIVQSLIFNDLLLCSYPAPSVVVSAPTGSGKTVAFELAIVRELREANEQKVRG